MKCVIILLSVALNFVYSEEGVKTAPASEATSVVTTTFVKEGSKAPPSAALGTQKTNEEVPVKSSNVLTTPIPVTTEAKKGSIDITAEAGRMRVPGNAPDGNFAKTIEVTDSEDSRSDQPSTTQVGQPSGVSLTGQNENKAAQQANAAAPVIGDEGVTSTSTSGQTGVVGGDLLVTMDNKGDAAKSNGGQTPVQAGEQIIGSGIATQPQGASQADGSGWGSASPSNANSGIQGQNVNYNPNVAGNEGGGTPADAEVHPSIGDTVTSGPHINNPNIPLISANAENQNNDANAYPEYTAQNTVNGGEITTPQRQPSPQVLQDQLVYPVNTGNNFFITQWGYPNGQRTFGTGEQVLSSITGYQPSFHQTQQHGYFPGTVTLSRFFNTAGGNGAYAVSQSQSSYSHQRPQRVFYPLYNFYSRFRQRIPSRGVLPFVTVGAAGHQLSFGPNNRLYGLTYNRYGTGFNNNGLGAANVNPFNGYTQSNGNYLLVNYLKRNGVNIPGNVFDNYNDNVKG